LLLSQKRVRGQARMLGLSTLIGIVAGLGAIVFYTLVQTVEHTTMAAVANYEPEPHPAGEEPLSWLPNAHGPLNVWYLLGIVTVGGLVSGVLVYTVAPEAEGHGTDSVIAAYHTKQGYMRPRVPLVKIIASAITIGTGGSGGREGPIAQIGAGFGSVLSGLVGLRPAERRVLLAAGMGAGIGAIFRAPLAGALFASEVLYRSPEFESEVILPAALASVVAYSTFASVFGWDPLFAMPDFAFDNAWQLAPYFLLAVCMAFLAFLYTRSFYGLRNLFKRLPIMPHFRPAIGALLTGLVGVGLYFAFDRNPRALSVMASGYSSLQEIVVSEHSTPALLLLAIALGKILTTSLTIGSGGSGGVFGPSMVIGGCGGAALGLGLQEIAPALVPHPASYAVVGMASFFAAAAKTPFSTLVMVSEMTGGYHLLLPALWGCSISFMTSDEQSIYDAQVESRSRSPAHQGSYVRDVLSDVRIERFLPVGTLAAALHAEDTLDNVLDRFDEKAGAVLPVVDGDNRLVGVVNLDEVFIASHAPELRPLILTADLMRTNVVPLSPSDSLDRALELFVENDLRALPIVNNLKDRNVLGMITRTEVTSSYLRRLHGPLAATAGSR
jgi:CIC family chloride channel protein